MRRIQQEVCYHCSMELYGMLSVDTGYEGKTHIHPFYELFFVRKGSFTLLFDQASCILREGELCVISPDTRHRCVSDGNSVLLYVGVGLVSQWKKTMLPCYTPVSISPLPAAGLVLKLLEETDSDQNLSVSAPLLTGAVSVLIHELLTSAPLSQRDILSEKIKGYIQEHLHESISLPELADAMYMNPKYLGSLFKQMNGISVKEYIQQQKMNRAIVLLKDEILSVSDIAQQLGFDTVQYFSTKFRSYFGISPRTFRRQIQNRRDPA